jgi:hypothetical protein
MTKNVLAVEMVSPIAGAPRAVELNAVALSAQETAA